MLPTLPIERTHLLRERKGSEIICTGGAEGNVLSAIRAVGGREEGEGGEGREGGEGGEGGEGREEGEGDTKN